MGKRILIAGAGTGSTNNLIRSLRLGDPSLYIVGCHYNRFALRQSQAERNYLLPPVDHPAFVRSLNRLIEKEDVELVIPNSDVDVRALAASRSEIACRLFLPRTELIDLCQDKYRLCEFLAARGIPAPVTYPITSLDDVGPIFDKFDPSSRLWCRLRTGQGGMGAMLVRNAEQARAWIQYWEQSRRTPPSLFTLSEYLPGRDLACQALFKEGRLILIKSYERLTYLGGSSHPTGFSSLAALSKTVIAPRAVETCAAAVTAIDPQASGVFCFDLRENAAGTPCLTEINAGRFGLSTGIFDIPGRYNTASVYVELAFNASPTIAETYDTAEGYYMVRDYDTEPAVWHGDQFFDGTEEVWDEGSMA